MSKHMQTLRPVTDITDYADIFYPDSAEPPILSPNIRLVIRQWMVELGAEDELKKCGLKARRTAIFAGPPGCGKTTLAHHFAARLGLPLVVVNMASLVSCYLGNTGRNINTLFRAIKEQGDSCVLFLDEFDSVATKRANSHDSGASQERASIVIALLQMIDTFTGSLIAATNQEDSIDPAIWRRFGLHLVIKEPEDEERYAILTRYLAPYALEESAMNLLCEATAGASPAVLRQLMEGVKRDLILAPRYGQSTDAAPIFQRLIESVRPHGDAALPPLWDQAWVMDAITKMPWPPQDGRTDDKAA